MGDEAFGRRIPFAFLGAILKDFEQGSFAARASSAIAYSMNRDFGPVYVQLLTRCGGVANSVLPRPVESYLLWGVILFYFLC